MDFHLRVHQRLLATNELCITGQRKFDTTGLPVHFILTGDKWTKNYCESKRSKWVYYLVSERKLGFFVKVKEDQNFNRRNILNILRIKIFIWRTDWRKRQFSFGHYLYRAKVPGDDIRWFSVERKPLKLEFLPHTYEKDEMILLNDTKKTDFSFFRKKSFKANTNEKGHLRWPGWDALERCVVIYYSLLTFLATGPLSLSSTSKLTRWPSARLLNPTSLIDE